MTQAEVDALFAIVEGELANHPILLADVVWLQAKADSFFTPPPAGALSLGVSASLIQAVGDFVFGLLEIRFVTNPVVLAAVTGLKGFFDACFAGTATLTPSVQECKPRRLRTPTRQRRRARSYGVHPLWSGGKV